MISVRKKDISVIIIAIIAFYSVMNITYLAQVFHINGTMQMIVRVAILAGIILLIAINHRGISKIFLLLVLWWGIMLLSTVINGGDCLNLLLIQSRAMVVCFVCEYYRNDKGKLYLVLKTWAAIMLLLCVADIISIISFPEGLYIGDDGYVCFLLGYKTARLVYTLPLAILSAFLSLQENNRLTITTDIVIGLCVIDAYLSEATASSVSMLLFFILILVAQMGQRGKIIDRIYSFLFSWKTVLIMYIIIFAVLVVIQSNSVITYVAQNLFDKSDTLSHRTIIWANCLYSFLKSPIYGQGYLSTAEYVKITKWQLGTSAHNMMLTILVTGGMCLLATYVYIFIYSMSAAEKKIEKSNIPLVLGIVISLILGVTSSAFVNSAFAFIPYILILYTQKEDKIQYE